MYRQPSVYAVTLNWNGIADTRKCLDSLLSEGYSNLQVVCIDNNSDNNEAAKLKDEYPTVKVIKNETNLGFAGGCNVGIKHALDDGTDYVMLFNNDAVIVEDSIAKMVEFYEAHSDVGMVSPTILYADEKTVWFYGAKLSKALGFTINIGKGKVADSIVGKDPFQTGFCSGCTMLVHRNVIEQIGLMDEEYFVYYEDLDWCTKADNIGLESWVVPHATVFHKKSASTGEGGKSRFGPIPAYYLARNAFMYAKNMPKGPNKLIYIAAQFYSKLPLSLALLVHPKSWGRYLKGMYDGMLMLYRR